MKSKPAANSSLERVLIANDSLSGIDIALQKAARIEHYCGAEIEVAEVIYDTIAEEPEAVLPRRQQAALIEGLKAAERNGLESLVAPYRDRIANITHQVIWNKNASKGITDHARGFDLLIKPGAQRSHLTDRLNAPLDWSLMRTATTPVLISKHDWPDTNLMVAALDVADAEHESLNRRILQVTAELAKIIGASVHVLCAYPSLGQTAGELQVALDYAGIKADMKASRSTLISSLLSQLDLEVEQIHLLEGKPGAVIPALANKLGATITVLGTAARRGLAQLIIGNTAERIIGALDGDIVTIREAAP